MGLAKGAVKFTPQQMEYIAKILVDCWKQCHNEHCHQDHDCKNDVDGLIRTLLKFGFNEREIYANILGLELNIKL